LTLVPGTAQAGGDGLGRHLAGFHGMGLGVSMTGIRFSRVDRRAFLLAPPFARSSEPG